MGMIYLTVLQLSSIGVTNDEPARQALRQLLFTSPDISKYISGVVSGEHGLDRRKICAGV